MRKKVVVVVAVMVMVMVVAEMGLEGMVAVPLFAEHDFGIFFPHDLENLISQSRQFLVLDVRGNNLSVDRPQDCR